MEQDTVLSPIQMETLGGTWMPKGSPYKCKLCGFLGTTKANMYLLKNERILCHNCAD